VAYFVVVFAVLLALLCVAAALLLLSYLRVEVFDSAWFKASIGIAAVALIADIAVTGQWKPRRAAGGALRISAIAHATWWELRYETPAGSFATANEMHVPPDQTIDVLVVADHPHLLLAPGSPLSGRFLRIRARGDTAAFDVAWRRVLRLQIIADGRFDQWLRDQARPAPAPLNDLEIDGRAVFATARCTFCHTVRGVAEAETPLAPDLTHLGSRRTLAAGLLPNRPGQLAGWVVNAEALKPGCGMPMNAMKPERLRALLAYLGRLR